MCIRDSKTTSLCRQKTAKNSGMQQKPLTKRLNRTMMKQESTCLLYTSSQAQLASLLGVDTTATSLQDMTEFELPQKKLQRVQP